MSDIHQTYLTNAICSSALGSKSPTTSNMKRSSTIIKHRRNGVASFKDYSELQFQAPTKSPRFRRYSDREPLSPLDTNRSPLWVSGGYNQRIPVAKSLEEKVVGEGMPSAHLDQKMPLRGENFEEGKEVEEEQTKIEVLLNEALTWFGASITPLVGGLFNFPKLEESRHQHPQGKNSPIIIELLVRIDEFLDEIQNHGLYQGHPAKLIDRGANPYNDPLRRHRYTHPQPHLPIRHASRVTFSFETNSLPKTLWEPEEGVDEPFFHSDSDNSESDYEEGDGCALSLLELGTPLPPLPLKWSQIVMDVQPLSIITVKPRGDPLRCRCRRWEQD
ncbi:hypothetical protein BGX38DRAFT_1139739 [Terfezia claveryi]|nr:hypothetical protein BGX38DRAFT_1139739 [Terfezia claveryi]